MRILIFLCILSVLALAFASPVPEDEEEEINKRFLRHHTISPRLYKLISHRPVKVAKNATMGAKEVGQLVTKEGLDFGTLFVTPTGDALLKFSKVVYKLSRLNFLEAKQTFEKRVKNVKFEDVLYKLFPLVSVRFRDCKQFVPTALAAAGADAAEVKAAEPVYWAVCNVGKHITDALQSESRLG